MDVSTLLSLLCLEKLLAARLDLGKTSTLFATDDDSGNTMAWISSWRSAERLQKWAMTLVHRKGMNAFNRLQKDNPHMGIMHELYSAPKNQWETIYINFKPFRI